MRRILLVLCLMSISFLFGQGTLHTGLNGPYDVIADSSGNIYIGDSNNKRVLKSNADGSDPVVIKVFDRAVFGLEIINNKIFVSLVNAIVKMDMDGSNVEHVTSANSAYYFTSGKDGYIYFANAVSGGSIQKVKEDGTDLSTVASNLNKPMGITYDPALQRLIFSQTGSGTVQSIKKDGTGNQYIAAGLSNPHNLRLDASGNIYVANTGLNQIRKISSSGATHIFPNTNFNAPTSTFVTKNGRILVADCWGGKIRYLDPLAANYLKFNGLNSYVSGTNATLPQGNQERTIEAVIKVPSVRTNPSTASSIFNYGTFSNSKRFCLMVSGGKLSFVGEFNDAYGTTDLRDDRWHHVAVTFKNNTVKLYIDGFLEKSAVLQNLTTAGTSFLIGASQRTVIDEFFEGGIDEVRVWNRALSQMELQNNLSCELADPATQNGLVAYYQFNQGINEADNSTVSALTDITGNSDGNQLNNFLLSGTTSNWLDGSSVRTGNTCPVYVPFLSCANVSLPHGEMASENPSITWSSVENAESYNVYVGTAPGTYDVVNGLTTTSASYTLTNLSASTIYYVSVVPANSDTVATNCAESSFMTGTVLGVANSGKSPLSVYPNPVTNKLFINSDDAVSSYTIYGADGRMVAQNTKVSTKQIDVSKLQTGVYVVKIQTPKGEQSFRIIKNN